MKKNDIRMLSLVYQNPVGLNCSPEDMTKRESGGSGERAGGRSAKRVVEK
jgi:hypothetical protein